MAAGGFDQFRGGDALVPSQVYSLGKSPLFTNAELASVNVPELGVTVLVVTMPMLSSAANSNDTTVVADDAL